MPKAKVSPDDIARIRALATDGLKQAQIAAQVGIDPSRVSRILSGESFKTDAPATGAVRDLPVDQVHPDPEQPRKLFDADALVELAASIREFGLVQPITVRRDPAGGWLIVAGERRYRAHVLNGAATIAARIVDWEGADVRIAQIVENLQRADLRPCEEGRSYRAAMEENDWTQAELARRLGIPESRLMRRLMLLNLRPEYQALVDSGQLLERPARQMGRLPPHRQDELFRLVKAGKADGKSARAFANAALEAESQLSLIEAPEPAAGDIESATRLERRINRALAVLQDGFDEGEVIAARRVDPTKAATYADKLALIQKALGHMERALRRSAAQLEFAA